VLDFIGQHRAEFRFDRRLGALLGGHRRELEKQVQDAFPFLPAGCHRELDRVAREVVLASIRNAVPSRWSAKVDELRALAATHPDLTLATYLERTGLDLEDLYAGGKSWSDLCQDAGLPIAPPGPQEEVLRRACGRLLHVDDAARLAAYRRLLAPTTPPDPSAFPRQDQRTLRMLVASLLDKALTKTTPLPDACALLWAHPQIRAEVLALRDVLGQRLTHLPLPLPSDPDVPLAIHARYTRLEILAAFGVGTSAKVAPPRSPRRSPRLSPWTRPPAPSPPPPASATTPSAAT